MTVTSAPLSGEQNGSYDPWLDYNDDGVVNANDLFYLSQTYGTVGDPTKNVNVTNWRADQSGNLKVSPAELIATGWLTAELRKLSRPTNGFTILSNSSEIDLGGVDIIILGGDVSGGLTWSWFSSVSNNYGNAAASTSGWSQGTGRVYLYNSTGNIVAGMTLPVKDKARISGVDKIRLIVEVVVPDLEWNVGAWIASYVAAASATVYWTQS